MHEEFDYQDCFGATADALIEDLHAVEAGANAHDIARMRVYVACDARRVYRRDDSDNAARWLAIEVGISPWKAARWLQAGYALDKLPTLSGSYERGELSTDKFVELARFATPETEAGLLAWAQRTSPAGIRARGDRELRVATEEVRDADKLRSLRWDWYEDHTRLDIWGSLPADQGAKFIAAVDRLANRLPALPIDDPDPEDNIEARRADALVAMASATIADDRAPDKATLVVHTDVESLLEGDRNGILAGGLPLPPEAASLVACDSRVQTVLHDEHGGIFHISSPSYVVPRWLRRQVEHRDGGRCTFPGCGQKAHVQVHHIVSWPKGTTVITNLTLVCPAHHRLVHIHGWHAKLAKDGTTHWYRPDWTPYQPRPAPVAA